MPVPDAPRLVFREMSDPDLPEMAALLGDPDVMAYYPRPKTKDEAQAWIDWNKRNYAEFDHGLWIIEAKAGEFIGDCGLTRQPVNDRIELEVGYHVRPRFQGLGYATEAAAACRDFARTVLNESHLVAIIDPRNAASRRVAEKIGMTYEADDHGGQAGVRSVYGMVLA